MGTCLSLTQQRPITMLIKMEAEVAIFKKWPSVTATEAHIYLQNSYCSGLWKFLDGNCNSHHYVLTALALIKP